MCPQFLERAAIETPCVLEKAFQLRTRSSLKTLHLRFKVGVGRAIVNEGAIGEAHLVIRFERHEADMIIELLASQRKELAQQLRGSNDRRSSVKVKSIHLDASRPPAGLVRAF